MSADAWPSLQDNGWNAAFEKVGKRSKANRPAAQDGYGKL
jgi:hypothetical protein